MQLEAHWLGRVGYDAATALLRALAAARATGGVADTLLLLEHEHVYTLGRRASISDVLLDAETLAKREVMVAVTDRGGLVTYHGPGQLVGYPILDLGSNASTAAYVADLERALIQVLAGFGVSARTIEGLRGVWVDDAKIAAIGVHVSNGITTHGFALNVDPDLSMFDGIVACGLADRRTTSIAEQTGARIPLTLVAKRAARSLAETLDRDLRWPGPSALAPFRLGAIYA